MPEDFDIVDYVIRHSAPRRPKQFDAGGGVFGDDDWGGPADTGYNMNSLLGGTLGQSKGMNLFANTYNAALAADAANQGIGASHSTAYDPSAWAAGNLPVVPVVTGPIFNNQPISSMTDEELLAAYGAALEVVNTTKSRTDRGTTGYEGVNTYFDDLAAAEGDWEEIKDAITARGLEMPTGTFTQNVSAIGRTVGGWFDKIFDFFGIAKPDYAVGQPGPGGTLIWGTPQGNKVFSKIGTTPGGTIAGVQTGIPALDRILSKTADVLTGRVEAGDILNAETVAQMVLDAATDELDLDPGTISVGDLQEGVTTVMGKLNVVDDINEATNNTVFGVDTTAADPEVVTTADPEVVTTADPEVVTTADPEVVTADPEVVTADPEVVTADPEVVTDVIADVIADPEVVTTADPEVVTADPEVVTDVIADVIADPEVVTTADPEVVTADPEVVTDVIADVIADPEVVTDVIADVIADPEVVTTADPEVVTADPEVVTDVIADVIADPEVVTDVIADVIADPEVVTADPEVVTDVIADVIADPEVVTTADPEVVTADPEVVITPPIVDTLDPITLGGTLDEITLGGATSDEIFTDLQTPGGDKTLTAGGGDKTLGGGGGGGGLGLGDSGFRGYKDEPGDLVGDFPLVTPYGEYTMEEMMAALDRIIGVTEDLEKG